MTQSTNRRTHLQLLAATGLAPVLGCGGDDDSDIDAPERDASPDAPLFTDSRVPAEDAGVSWASGGTLGMTEKEAYPNPFLSALDACILVASSTAGPCTTTTDLDREDISEGWRGLPVRLAFKVVDSVCDPIAGATVKVWHTNVEGSYSGQTPSNRFCLLNQDYQSQNFFRGVRKTSEIGEVYFDTCYPGWYPGRAIHIHFQVERGDMTYRVSQVFFPEVTTREVFAGHPDYQSFGQPDRDHSSDGVLAAISGRDRERLILNVAKMSDGAMMASKVLAVS